MSTAVLFLQDAEFCETGEVKSFPSKKSKRFNATSPATSPAYVQQVVLLKSPISDEPIANRHPRLAKSTNVRFSELEAQMRTLQSELEAQQEQLEAQQTKMEAQQTKMEAQQTKMEAQQTHLARLELHISDYLELFVHAQILAVGESNGCLQNLTDVQRDIATQIKRTRNAQAHPVMHQMDELMPHTLRDLVKFHISVCLDCNQQLGASPEQTLCFEIVQLLAAKWASKFPEIVEIELTRLRLLAPCANFRVSLFPPSSSSSSSSSAHASLVSSSPPVATGRKRHHDANS